MSNEDSPLADRVFVLFLASVFLLSVTVAAVNKFFALYVDAFGASEDLVGLSWAIAALSEVPVMFLSGALLRRLAARGLLGSVPTCTFPQKPEFADSQQFLTLWGDQGAFESDSKGGISEWAGGERGCVNQSDRGSGPGRERSFCS